MEKVFKFLPILGEKMENFLPRDGQKWENFYKVVINNVKIPHTFSTLPAINNANIPHKFPDQKRNNAKVPASLYMGKCHQKRHFLNKNL